MEIAITITGESRADKDVWFNHMIRMMEETDMDNLRLIVTDPTGTVHNLNGRQNENSNFETSK